MSENHAPIVTAAERDALARRGLVLVEAEARRSWYRYRGRIDLDELRSIGREALVHALAKFDPSRGRFESFALARIRGAMKDEARKRQRRRLHRRPTIIARPSSEAVARGGFDGSRDRPRAGVPRRGEPGTVVPGGDLAEMAMCHRLDPEAEAVASDEAQVVRDVVAGLPRRQRRFIERHYFADEPISKLTEDFEVSRHALRRLHIGSLDTMGRRLRRRGRFGRTRSAIKTTKGATGRVPSSRE